MTDFEDLVAVRLTDLLIDVLAGMDPEGLSVMIERGDPLIASLAAWVMDTRGDDIV